MANLSVQGELSRSGELNRSEGETIHWGVLCRVCRELVAFDVSPYTSFGPGAASMHPGAIRCGAGHVHIYFPRDFQFISRALPVPQSTMKENREQFLAFNPRVSISSNRHPWKVTAAKSNEKPHVPPSTPKDGDAEPAHSGPDPRREAAQKAAKERWANWAGKKAM